jgi:predicted deacylase
MICDTFTKRTVTCLNLPAMTPGSHRTLTVRRYGNHEARPKAYLQAGLHGNEHAGLLVLHHLLRKLDALARESAENGVREWGQTLIIDYCAL